jgi:alpha-L-arabinofuranosidase
MTSCPANALQPYRQNDNSWDQGQIFFTPAKVWGMPPFYVQKMASANCLPERIYSAMEGAGLDISATRSETGNALVIHVVNTSSESVHSRILLKHFTGAGREIKAWTLSAGSEEENTLQDPVKISPKETLINTESVLENGFVFPPFSYVILRFEN